MERAPQEDDRTAKDGTNAGEAVPPPANIERAPPPSRVSGFIMIAIVVALLVVCALLYFTSAPAGLSTKQSASQSSSSANAPAEPVPAQPATPRANAPAANKP